MRSSALVFVLLLLGCEATNDLVVDLRTDYVPGQEVARAETFLGGVSQDAETFVLGDDLLAGRRIAQLSVPSRTHDIEVRLYSPSGEEVARQTVRVTVGAATSVTVLITRDCAPIVCPATGAPSADQCVGGRCVSPECTPETPEACPVPGCTSDSECGTTADCSSGACIAGTCFEAPVDGFCAADEWCQPGAGCTALMSPADGGVPMNVLDGVTSFAIGQQHGCAIRGAGEVWCWGNNLDGALGQPGGDSHAAVRVPGVSDAVAIVAGTGWTCAALRDESIQCWGRNDRGQLGRDSGGEPNGTVGTVTGGVAGLGLFAGSHHACVLNGLAGQRWCWGDNTFAQAVPSMASPIAAPTELTTGPALLGFALGEDHTCTYDVVNILRCHGRNTSGELADTTMIDRPDPTEVPGIATVVAVEAAHGFADADEGSTCAIELGGDLYCWGSDSAGQLGTNRVGGGEGRVVQVEMTGVERLWSGARLFCARLGGGETFCWGQNTHGQLGLGTTDAMVSAPQRAPMLEAYSDLGLGFGFSCGLLGDRIQCWGDNTFGQVTGDRNPGERLLTPVDLVRE